MTFLLIAAVGSCPKLWQDLCRPTNPVGIHPKMDPRTYCQQLPIQQYLYSRGEEAEARQRMGQNTMQALHISQFYEAQIQLNGKQFYIPVAFSIGSSRIVFLFIFFYPTERFKECRPSKKRTRFETYQYRYLAIMLLLLRRSLFFFHFPFQKRNTCSGSFLNVPCFIVCFLNTSMLHVTCWKTI